MPERSLEWRSGFTGETEEMRVRQSDVQKAVIRSELWEQEREWD